MRAPMAERMAALALALPALLPTTELDPSLARQGAPPDLPLPHSCATSDASQAVTFSQPLPLQASAGSPNTPPGSGGPLAVQTPVPLAVNISAAGPVAGVWPAAASASSPQLAAHASAMLCRTQVFVHAVQRSPLLKSALLSLEVGTQCRHPGCDQGVARDVGGTLAQMLALHMRAGYDTASEEELLALLWTLESWGDVMRSRCSDVLYSYLTHLNIYDKQRAREMSRDWERQFTSLQCAVAAAQLDLLKRLSWMVRLDYELEVTPCRALLFPAPAPATSAALLGREVPRQYTGPAVPLGAVSGQITQQATPALGLGEAPGAVRWWGQHMDALRSSIEWDAVVVAASRPGAGPRTAEPGADGQLPVPHTKRVRLA